MTNYVKLFIAFVKGDEAEATAIKNQAKAIALIKAQIAQKEAKRLSLVEDVSEMETNLVNARLNGGELIGKNADLYLSNLVNAYEKLDSTKQSLENLDKEIEFFKNELAEISK